MRNKFAFCLIGVLWSATLYSSPFKFPLYTLGLKFSKPSNFYLLTTENLADVKRNIIQSNNICETTKLSVESTMKNPYFKVFMNVNDYNDQIIFTKLSRSKVDNKSIAQLKDEMKELCFNTKNISILHLSDSSGTTMLGNFISVTYQITTPELTYYSQGYFFSKDTYTLLVTVNSPTRKSNNQIISSIEDISPKNYQKLIIDIDNLINQKNFSNALKKIDTCISIDSENPFAYDKRMAINLNLKKYDKVIIEATTVLEKHHNYLNAIILKGLAYNLDNNYQKAIDNYEQATTIFGTLSLLNLQNEYHTSFAQLYRLKGEAYLNLKDSKKATDNLFLALELLSDSLNTGAIYYNLGLTESSLNRNIENAIKFYSLAIENYPKEKAKEKSEAFFNRGINYRKKGENEKAFSDYSNAIKIRPDYAKAYNNRASIKLMQEDFKGAITDCTNAIKFDNNKTEITRLAYYNRGVAKINLNDATGCSDFKKAKALGEKISKEILDACNIR